MAGIPLTFLGSGFFSDDLNNTGKFSVNYSSRYGVQGDWFLATDSNGKVNNWYVEFEMGRQRINTSSPNLDTIRVWPGPFDYFGSSSETSNWVVTKIDEFDLPFSYLPPSAIPEPESYALMLAGLGSIGAFAKRKKSA